MDSATSTKDTPASKGHEKAAAPEEKVKVQAHADSQAAAEKLRAEGSEAGYKSVVSSLDQAKKTLKPDQFGQYRDQLATDLEKAGTLPQLSLAWTDKVAQTGKLGLKQPGVVGMAELNSFTTETAYDPLTRKLASAAVERLTPVAQANLSSDVSTSQIKGLIETDSREAKQESLTTSQQKMALENASYMSQRRPDLQGLTLLEAADRAGAAGDPTKMDKQVGKQDFEALLKNPFAKLSEDDEVFVKHVLENWDDPQIAGMAKDGLISKDSIEALATKYEKAQKPEESEVEVAAKPENELGKQADIFTSKRPELNGMSIFKAADVAGANNKSQIDGRVEKQDVQALLNNPFANIDSTTRKQLGDMVKHWDEAKYSALRDGRAITADSLTAANLGLTLEQHRQKQELDLQSGDALKTRNAMQSNASYLLESKVGDRDLITAAATQGGGDSKAASREDFQKLLESPFANLSEDDHAFVASMVENWNEPEFAGLRQNGSSLTVEDVQRLKAAS